MNWVRGWTSAGVRINLSRMKSSFCWLVLVLVTLGGFTAVDGQPSVSTPTAPAPEKSGVWLTNYAKAVDLARSEHRLMLLDFTGSDWCVWCHRLDREILTKKPFLDYARKHLVLVELDFPRYKPQTPALVRQNQTLEDKFAVTGYPTIVLVNPQGREIGRTGYMEGGPKTFVRELEYLARKAKRGPAS